MSYQSLEDRIVKNFFTQATKSMTPLTLPVELPNSAASYRLLFNGSAVADAKEQESNPRSQSMRMRAIERLSA
jgi:16S rRNA (cytosine1402-N4)-methyltransferase